MCKIIDLVIIYFYQFLTCNEQKIRVKIDDFYELITI
jgi:hypothetical protein